LHTRSCYNYRSRIGAARHLRISDWSALYGYYGKAESYTAQFRELEKYAIDGTDGKAGARMQEADDA
jgi:hypothetical protein